MSDVLWATEFLLSLAGAVLSSARRFYLLAALLSVRVIADIFEHFLRGDAYGVTWWSAEALGSLLLCALACQVAARMFAEHGPILPHICFLMIVCGALGYAVFVNDDGWMNKFLDAEIAVSMFVGVLLVIAYLTRRKFLDRTWAGIAVGIVVYLAGNSLCAMLWKFWAGAPDLYAAPAILALLIWVWAVGEAHSFGAEIRTEHTSGHLSGQ